MDSEFDQYEMEGDDELIYDTCECGDIYEQEENLGEFYENSYAESMNTILLSENQIYAYLQEYIALISEKENGVEQGEQVEVDTPREEIFELEKFLNEERERIRLEQQQADLDEVIENKTKSELVANDEEVEQKQKEETEIQENSFEEIPSNREEELGEEIKQNLIEEYQVEIEGVIELESEYITNEEELENQELKLEELQSNGIEERLEKREYALKLDNIENEIFEIDFEEIVHEEELERFEEEREKKGEYEGLNREQELPNPVQEFEVTHETNTNEIETLIIRQEEVSEHEITSQYKEVEYSEKEEYLGSQQELDEILEQNRKIEQQTLIEIEREGKLKGEQSKEQEKEQKKEDEWILYLKDWINEESGDIISLQIKNEVIEIIEKFNELDGLSIKFVELYKQKKVSQLSQSERKELKALIKTLQERDPSNIVLFTNLRAFKRSLNHHKFETLLEKAQINRVINHLFTRFSPIKQVNKILKSHNKAVSTKKNKKKCRRCQKVLSYDNFEKYGGERGKKEGKQKYRTICKSCRKEIKSIRALRKKAKLILDLFEGICSNCHTGLWFLPSFEFHHTQKELKKSSWRKLSQSSFKTLKNWATNEKVNALCGNCHSREQAKYYKEFRNLILKKNLFKLHQKEIEELINVSINHHAKFKYSKSKSNIKYQIKRWIRKRYVIEQIYNGKCIACGLEAKDHLPSVIFHHIDEKKKTLSWNDLQDLDCEEILRSLIDENCVCLCLNCHGLLHSTFNSNAEKIFEGLFNGNEIRKFSSELEEILTRINNEIIKFKFDLETIQFASPLKYTIAQNEIWKLKMLKIFSYLENRKQSYFRTNDIMSVFNNNYHRAYEIISTLAEKGFILPVKKDGFTQNYYKFSGEGIKKVKELQQSYDLHEDLKTLDKVPIISKQRMENDDILDKYPKIIKNIIDTKGYNEFTVKELAETIGKSTVNISRILREKLIPIGYVKVKNSAIITKKRGSTKIYFLNNKIFDI